MAKKYDVGVKEYPETYWMPEYTPLDTDLLACFKITPQEGVPREEVAAAVDAESSTGTWTTVWTDLLTDLDRYKGRAHAIEDVPGDDTKKAIEELYSTGVLTYCQTLDPHADAYVKRIFGENNYTIIDNVDPLPEKLPQLFASLTA